MGELNRTNIPNTISWEIVTRAPTFSPVTKSCRLCLMYLIAYIMYHSSTATLNVKSEFFSGCLHKKKLLLKNFKKRNPGWIEHLAEENIHIVTWCCTEPLQSIYLSSTDESESSKQSVWRKIKIFSKRLVFWFNKFIELLNIVRIW